jgi:hypothetical protein
MRHSQITFWVNSINFRETKIELWNVITERWKCDEILKTFMWFFLPFHLINLMRSQWHNIERWRSSITSWIIFVCVLLHIQSQYVLVKLWNKKGQEIRCFLLSLPLLLFQLGKSSWVAIRSWGKWEACHIF